LQPVNGGFEPTDTAVIRRWLNSPDLGPALREPDFTVPELSDEVVDTLLTVFLEVDRLGESVTLVRTALSGWTATVAGQIPPNVQEGVQPGSAAYGVAVFSSLVHVGQIHGCDMEWLLWFSAALATRVVKRCFRISRCPPMGSDRTYVESFIAARSGVLSEPGQRNTDVEAPSRQSGRSVRGEENRPESVYKLPLETEDFQGGTADLPYAAFKQNVQTAVKFYGIRSERDALLYLFRHLAKSLRWELISLAGTETPPLGTVWDLLDEKFGYSDTPGSVAARWESLKQAEGETVLDLYSRLLRERVLYWRVTESQLPPAVVAAKFVAALAPPLREALEQAWGRVLGDLTAEQVRDHAVFYEERQTAAQSIADKAARNRRSGNANSYARPGGTPNPTSGPTNGQGKTQQQQQGGTPSAQRNSIGSSVAAGVRCKFCSEKGYRKADKHTDATCWENPANASKRPPWFKPLEGRSQKPPETPNTAIVEAGKTFMTCTLGTGGLVGMEAIVQDETQTKELPALLLLDTGSEYTLASTGLIASLGVELTPYERPMVLAGAGKEGSIAVTGEVTLPVIVKGTDGRSHRFRLTVHVAANLNQDVARSSAVLLGLTSLEKMRARIAIGESTVFLEAIGATVSLCRWSSLQCLSSTRSVSSRKDRLASDPIDAVPLPSEAEIAQRLQGWRFPDVEVELKSRAVRPRPRRPYASSAVEMTAMEMIVDNLEKANVVRRVPRDEVDNIQAWVNPAFLVPKAGRHPEEELTAENVEKQYRLVIDARGINECVEDLPSVWKTYQATPTQCISEIPSGPIYLGSVDIRSAYYNLKYSKESQKFFAFSYYASDGSVAYAVHEKMVMGFKGSSFHWGQAAHALMAKALPELYRSDGPTQIIIYVDDILVWSRSEARCARIMELVAFAFTSVGAETPESKQRGPSKSLDFIGLRLRQDGFTVAEPALAELRQALRDRPTTLRGLRTKLGLCQFCRALWNARPANAESTLSHLIAPFTTVIGTMTTEKAKKSAKIPWNSNLQQAWDKLQQEMGDGFTHYHSFDNEPDGLQFIITADASPLAGAAVLSRLSRTKFLEHQEEISAGWLADNAHLIGFFTHRWNSAERNYDIACKELHIICHAVDEWKQLLLTYTMHNPRPKGDPASAGRIIILSDSSSALGKLAARADITRYEPGSRQVKRWLSWLSLVSEFDPVELQFKHIPGRLNGFSDLLSRLLDQGRRYLPEGGGNPVVLATIDPSTQSDGSPRDNSDDTLARVLCDDGIQSELRELQKADDETKVHGASLKEYHQHFEGSKALPRSAVEAVQLGLIGRADGVIMTISDVNESGEVLVPVIPVGVIPGLQALINTNVQTNWTVREWLLFCVHELGGHGGYHHLRAKLVSRVWWPSILPQAQRWVQSCDYCMQQKAAARLKLMSAPRVARGLVDLELRGKYIALDHGYPAQPPLWLAASNPAPKAFLVITCVATGYTVVRAVDSVDGGTTTRCLFEFWVPYMGIPCGVMGDNFMDTPALRQSLAACGVRFLPTPPWAPWANGSAEARVARVKRILPSLRIPWDLAMPQVQLLINTHKRTSGYSSAELMYGTAIRTPADAVLHAVFHPHGTPSDKLAVLAGSTDVPAELRRVLSDGSIPRKVRSSTWAVWRDSPPGWFPWEHAVDWSRPAVATEVIIARSAFNAGDLLLVRLADGGDVIGRVLPDNDDHSNGEFVVHSGETYAAKDPVSGDEPLQRLATGGL
ncbi:hypothetical protein FOZ63_019093, partial [Perkinsus olseni]